MPAQTRKEPEERGAHKNRPEDGLKVKVVSCEIAKRLGDEICIKYREAFDKLKDR